MIEIYRHTLRYYWSVLLPLFVFAVVIETLSSLFGSMALDLASSFGWLIIL